MAEDQMVLPTCLECHLKDVKPGEDLCWSCLNEEQVAWEEGYTFNYTATYTLTVGKATFSTGSGSIMSMTFPTVTMINGDTLHLTWKPDDTTQPSGFPIALISIT